MSADRRWVSVTAWSHPRVNGECTLLLPPKLAASAPDRAVLRPAGRGRKRAVAVVRGGATGSGGQLSPALAARLGVTAERASCDVRMRPLRRLDPILYGKGGLLASVVVLLAFVAAVGAAVGTMLTSKLPLAASIGLLVVVALAAAAKCANDYRRLALG